MSPSTDRGARMSPGLQKVAERAKRDPAERQLHLPVNDNYISPSHSA